MNLKQDGKVRYLDVIKAIEMGIITVKTGYNSADECPVLSVTVNPKYTITDEFWEVFRANTVELFTRIKLKEEQERVNNVQ